MTAPRPYKRQMSVSAARQELVRVAGTQLDPAIVRAFLNISVGRLWRTIGFGAWIAQVPTVGRLFSFGGFGGVAGPIAAAAAATVLAVAGVVGPHRARPSPDRQAGRPLSPPLRHKAPPPPCRTRCRTSRALVPHRRLRGAPRRPPLRRARKPRPCPDPRPPRRHQARPRHPLPSQAQPQPQPSRRRPRRPPRRTPGAARRAPTPCRAAPATAAAKKTRLASPTAPAPRTRSASRTASVTRTRPASITARAKTTPSACRTAAPRGVSRWRPTRSAHQVFSLRSAPLGPVLTQHDSPPSTPRRSHLTGTGGYEGLSGVGRPAPHTMPPRG